MRRSPRHAVTAAAAAAAAAVAGSVPAPPVWASATTTPGPLTLGEVVVMTTERGGGAGLREVATAAGSAWVVSPDDDLVMRIDPPGTVTAAVPVEGAWAIAADGDTVWVGSSAGLVAVDAVTSEISTTVDVPGVHVAADGITAAGGRVWMAERGTLRRVDPATGEVTSIAVSGRFPRPAAGDGVTWVAPGGSGTGELYRIDRDTATVTTITVDADSVDAVAASGTAAWVVVDAAKLCRADTDHEEVACVGIGVEEGFEHAVSLAVGDDGYVWVAVEGSRDPAFPNASRVVVVDPDTLDVVTTAAIEGATSFFDIAAGGGVAWLTGAAGRGNAVFVVPVVEPVS